MDSRVFQDMARIASVTWIDQLKSRAIAKEIAANLALSNLSDTEIISKFFEILDSRRHYSENSFQNAHFQHSVNASIFSLNFQFRVLLVLTHGARWPYEKIAELLKIDRNLVEGLLWTSRLEFLERLRTHAPSLALTYPRSVVPRSRDCPRYQSDKPWTQSFIDGQTDSRTTQFLRSHLLDCKSCKEVLERYRRLHFSFNQILSLPDYWSQIARDYRAIRIQLNPEEATMKEHIWSSIERFLKFPRRRRELPPRSG